MAIPHTGISTDAPAVETTEMGCAADLRCKSWRLDRVGIATPHKIILHRSVNVVPTSTTIPLANTPHPTHPIGP